MATTTPTQIRIEESTKKQAVELLEGLGLNLSDAVNMFLRQVILQNGIPFEVKYPEFKPEAIEAMEEAALEVLLLQFNNPGYYVYCHHTTKLFIHLISPAAILQYHIFQSLHMCISDALFWQLLS